MQGETKTGRRVLVVEDDPDLRELLTYNLSAAGFVAQASETGTGALAMVRMFAPDVVLLDLVLPDTPGTDVFRSIIRMNWGSGEPAVMILSAKGDEVDRVVAFELGAYDYIAKPFSMRELILRVRSVLRSRVRGKSVEGPGRDPIVVGPLEVDVDGHRVLLNREELRLSRNEMRLLAHLAENHDRILSREHLLEHVWNYTRGVSTRTLDSHVARLRNKLGDAGSLLQTVRGIGLRLSADARGDSGLS